MGEKAFEQVTEYIDAMAAKFGVASEYVFEILIKQQMINGSVWIMFAIFCIVVAAIIGRIVFKTYKNAEIRRGILDEGINTYGKFMTHGDGITFGFTILAGIILSIIGVIVLFSHIPVVVNPEYYAIREILDVLKGGS